MHFCQQLNNLSFETMEMDLNFSIFVEFMISMHIILNELMDLCYTNINQYYDVENMARKFHAMSFHCFYFKRKKINRKIPTKMITHK